MTKLYHGSTQLFKTFDHNQIGNNGTAKGFGFYFSSDKKGAEHYADKYLYTVNANLKGALSYDKRTIKKTKTRVLLNRLHKDLNILNDFDDVSHYGEWKVMEYALYLLKDTHNDVDLFCELCTITGDKEAVSRAFLDLFGVNHWVTFDYGYNITVITISEDIEILEITEKEGEV